MSAWPGMWLRFCSTTNSLFSSLTSSWTSLASSWCRQQPSCFSCLPPAWLQQDPCSFQSPTILSNCLAFFSMVELMICTWSSCWTLLAASGEPWPWPSPSGQASAEKLWLHWPRGASRRDSPSSLQGQTFAS